MSLSTLAPSSNTQQPLEKCYISEYMPTRMARPKYSFPSNKSFLYRFRERSNRFTQAITFMPPHILFLENIIFPTPNLHFPPYFLCSCWNASSYHLCLWNPAHYSVTKDYSHVHWLLFPSSKNSVSYHYGQWLMLSPMALHPFLIIYATICLVVYLIVYVCYGNNL